MTGVDPSAEAIDAARRKEPACRFLEASAETLPFSSGSFDGVVFLNSLHHVALMDAALKEAARVTAIGGPIVVVEPMTSGSFFSALLPIEDETAVRRAAQAAIDLALASGLLRCLQVLDYDRSETFADLDAFLARVLSADRRREEQIARKRRDIETAFVQAARRDERGLMSLVQPLRAHVLVNGAAEGARSVS